jgi:hypothetical protein
MLASHGIDSADDVLRDSSGLRRLVSASARLRLRVWARDCARQFKFEPRNGVDPLDIRELDEKLSAQQEQWLDELARGVTRLRSLAQVVEHERQKVRSELEWAQKRLGYAEDGAQPG